MKRESMIFYDSWWYACKSLPEELRLKFLTSILEYGIEGEINDENSLGFIISHKQIDVNNKKFENSHKGGAPKGNENAKKQPRNNLKTTKEQPKNNQCTEKKQPNVNVNVNDNDININNKKEILKKKEDFDFIKEDFKPLIEDWLTYKKERRESYKSEKTIKIFYENLISLSGGDYFKAKKIVEQSIGNNWAGIFALKDKTNYETKYDNSKDKDYEFAGFKKL